MVNHRCATASGNHRCYGAAAGLAVRTSATRSTNAESWLARAWTSPPLATGIREVEVRECSQTATDRTASATSPAVDPVNVSPEKTHKRHQEQRDSDGQE